MLRRGERLQVHPLRNGPTPSGVENVGRQLMWLTPAEVAAEVDAYIRLGIDFVKYASNEHSGTSGGAFLAFSPDVQSAIVDAAHAAGRPAQAHSMSTEGLRIAVKRDATSSSTPMSRVQPPSPRSFEARLPRNRRARSSSLTAERLASLMRGSVRYREDDLEGVGPQYPQSHPVGCPIAARH